MSTIHDSVAEYFDGITTELLASRLNFNFSEESPDSVALVTNYADRYIKRYKMGAKMEYGFAIMITKSYSTDLDDVNIMAMNFCQSLMDWVKTQNRNRNFPDLPGNRDVLLIENMQNMPNLAQVNTQEQTARYMLQMRIVYNDYEV